MARFTQGPRSMTKGERYTVHYNSARANLLLAIIFTVVNSILACIGGNMYFLFSCSFPYAMVSEGAFSTGLMFSAEEYAELGYTEADMLPIWFLFIMLVPAVITLGIYMLCWIFSKKRVGWLIAATALFVLDTLFLILWYDVAADMIIDYLFHGWALFLLIRGCLAHFKLKEVQAQAAEVSGEMFEAVPEEVAEEQAQSYVGTKADTPVLHMADFSVKSRVFLEYREQNYDICYRRVGTVNELVINSAVYDLLDTGRMEHPHELCAYVDGHEIVAGYGADSRMYIRFDGDVLVKKIRWI